MMFKTFLLGSTVKIAQELNMVELQLHILNKITLLEHQFIIMDPLLKIMLLLAVILQDLQILLHLHQLI